MRNRSIYALLYLGVGATVFTYLCQNWGQKTVNATTTSLIVALEPIFATLFGVWIGNESFGSMFVWGGVFIMLGIFLAIYIQK